MKAILETRDLVKYLSLIHILNIYNVDTGKLVVGGNLMNEEVSYTDEDWEKTF